MIKSIKCDFCNKENRINLNETKEKIDVGAKSLTRYYEIIFTCNHCGKKNLHKKILFKSCFRNVTLYEETKEFWQKTRSNEKVEALKIEDYPNRLKEHLNDFIDFPISTKIIIINSLIQKIKELRNFNEDYKNVPIKNIEFIKNRIKNEIREYLKLFNPSIKELRDEFDSQKELNEFVRKLNYLKKKMKL